MKLTRLIALVLVWAGSLVAVGVWAAQAPPSRTPITPGQAIGEVITGADIGFQPVAPGEMNDNRKFIGKWMVKVNGQWRETERFVGFRR